MAGDVINIEDAMVHEIAELMCHSCGHRWIAVYPQSTLLKELVCPECGKSGGAFKTGQTLDQD